jgi:ketosteroid isomerase-like protein
MDDTSEIGRLKEKITYLEDKEKIREVIYTYVYAVDSKNMDQLLKIFDDEASFQYVQDDVRAKGKDEVRKFYQAVFDRYDVLMHKISNIMIQLDGQKASERCYWMVYEILKEGGGERWGEGYYQHQFVKVADTWKIKELIISARYFHVVKHDSFNF